MSIIVIIGERERTHGVRERKFLVREEPTYILVLVREKVWEREKERKEWGSISLESKWKKNIKIEEEKEDGDDHADGDDRKRVSNKNRRKEIHHTNIGRYCFAFCSFIHLSLLTDPLSLLYSEPFRFQNPIFFPFSLSLEPTLSFLHTPEWQ